MAEKKKKDISHLPQIKYTPDDPEYWAWRKNAGVNKKIESPELLWGYFCDYAGEVLGIPIEKEELIRGGILGGATGKIKLARPFTIAGFSDYLHHRGISSSLRKYYYNENNAYEEYIEVSERIQSVIYNKNFDGAAVGIFKENIIARLLSLADNRNLNVEGEMTEQELESRIEELLKQARKGR